MDKLTVGDKVWWRSSGGRSVGWIKRRLTKPHTIKGYTAKASKANPQFLVVTESGKEAAHKASALHLVDPYSETETDGALAP